MSDYNINIFFTLETLMDSNRWKCSWILNLLAKKDYIITKNTFFFQIEIYINLFIQYEMID